MIVLPAIIQWNHDKFTTHLSYGTLFYTFSQTHASAGLTGWRWRDQLSYYSIYISIYEEQSELLALAQEILQYNSTFKLKKRGIFAQLYTIFQKMPVSIIHIQTIILTYPSYYFL